MLCKIERVKVQQKDIKKIIGEVNIQPQSIKLLT